MTKHMKKYRSDVHARTAKKNKVVLAILVCLIVLFFLSSIVRMGGFS